MPRIELHDRIVGPITKAAVHVTGSCPKLSRRDIRNHHSEHAPVSHTQGPEDMKKQRLIKYSNLNRGGQQSVQSTAPTPTRNKANKRNVSFNPLVAVRSALHRNDYRDEESHAVWYSPEETIRMLDEAKVIVKKMNKGYPLNELESLSARGLECRTIRENMKRMEMRALACTVVCEEQERHWEEGHQDPELLALAYSGVSIQAQLEARRRGRMDELSAAMME